jgi:hypothetical protein
MVHIAVSAAAFAIIAKLPLGSVAYEAEVTSKSDGPRKDAQYSTRKATIAVVPKRFKAPPRVSGQWALHGPTEAAGGHLLFEHEGHEHQQRLSLSIYGLYRLLFVGMSTSIDVLFDVRRGALHGEER